MARKKSLSADIKETIQEYYKKGMRPFEIKRLLEEKLGVEVDYNSVLNQNPEVRKKRREYYQRPENKKRGIILRNIVGVVLDVFDSEELTTEEIKMRVTELFEVHFSTPGILEKKIQEAVENLRARFGGDAPIIRVKEDTYKLNKQSPYWRVCGKFARYN